MISLTRDEAIVHGYKHAVYSDCPEVLLKIRTLDLADFGVEAREKYGILMIFETDIHLTP